MALVWHQTSSFGNRVAEEDLDLLLVSPGFDVAPVDTASTAESDTSTRLQ